MAADLEYTAELGAFDCYYNDMKLYLNPSTMQEKFMSVGLVDGRVDGSIIGGGEAVFLPDHVKMETMLSEVRSSIVLNGPKKFGLLVKALYSVPSYRHLARQLLKKRVELLRDNHKATGKRISLNFNINTAKVKRFLKKSVSFKSASGATSPNVLLPTTETPSLESSGAANLPSPSSTETMSAASHTSATQEIPDASRISISNNAILDQPVTMSVIVKIAPRVATHWEDIGYCLLLEEHDMDIIRDESRDDLRNDCKKMLKRWVVSAKGREPKTWRTFIQTLLDIDIDPSSVIAVLEKEPVVKCLNETTGVAVANAFERAVKQGVRATNQFKIVMLGAEGAGKTSTVLSLLGKDFQPSQPSTVGADTHRADICNSFTVDRICVYNWRTAEFQHYLEEISTHYIHEMKEEITQALSSRSLPTEGHKEYNKVSESAGLEVLQSEVPVPDSNIKVVIYDLGGQEIYYEVHYLFLASHDVVFLTFNASVDLDEPVVGRHRYTMLHVRKETKKAQTTFEVIEATLQTIYSRFGGKEVIKGSLSYCNPTVIMVATHSVNLTDYEKEKITDTILRRLPGKLQDHFPKDRNDLIHFIDNDKRDTESFDRLRAVAVKAAAGNLTEEQPIAYLKFEENILTLSQEESEITKDIAFKIATEAGLEPTNDALLALLEYYTLKGILLYYPDVEALKNTIFISPQRVSNLVTCVIKTRDFGEIRPRADLLDKYKRFDDFGLLEEELLDDMLEKRNMIENVEAGSSIGYSKDSVLGLLKKFDLATEIDRNTKFENESHTYLTPDSGEVFFVPSMLVYNTIEVYKTLEGHTDNTVLYYFPDKFLPDIVFNHVLIRTTKWCIAEGHRIRCVSNGIGVFDFSNNKQSFALQCCLDVHCIKCHISVRKQVVHDKDLWQQRQDLFSRTKKIIDDVHKYYIGNTKTPVACIECPHFHDKEYTPGPHIFLDTIRSNTQCTVVNQPIPEDTYKLLLEPTDQSGVTAAARPVCVEGAVVIDQITDKELTPTPKDLNRHVTNKYADDWRTIGLELDLNYATLNIIAKDHQHDCVTCFELTLAKWLASNPHGTWRTLEVAITNANRSRLGLNPVDDIYCKS